MPNKKLNTQEAADYLGVKPCTLELWRCPKKGPRYFKLGSRVMIWPIWTSGLLREAFTPLTPPLNCGVVNDQHL